VPIIDGPSLDDNLSEVLGLILRRVEEAVEPPEPVARDDAPAGAPRPGPA
jgi:hypothetical protein